MTDLPRDRAVDLTNCDREPIHIPGAIQPHGVLLAFDSNSRLVALSANAGARLGTLPMLEQPLASGHLSDQVREAILSALSHSRHALDPLETQIDGQLYDVVMHRSEGLLVVEFEQRPADAPALEGFALRAQRAIGRIQAESSLDRLLEVAVNEIAQLNGFDRVMAYRFQHDDSGLVAAEAKRADLEPFLGLRYPASDIPAQARRLYTLNPLRLIADIAYVPVPLQPAVMSNGRPLDLSYSVLRSVSPIHVEYLQNMGVQASMSISIVVHGKLWGLFACHHMSPRRVPHAVRMACNLLSQVCGVLVERAITATDATQLERSLSVQTAALQRVLVSERLSDALTESPGVRELIDSDGAAVALAGDISRTGTTPSEDVLRELAGVLAARREEVFSTNRLSVDLPQLAQRLAPACGLLAVRFFKEQQGFVFWFRGEELQTVRWGGNPEKVYDEGPLGPRLSPRGSFAEWQQLVTGSSRPFSAAEQQIGMRLRRELQDLSLSRARARIQALENSNEELDRLAYVASHDLRAPLRAIASLSEFIEEDLEKVMTPEAKRNIQLLRSRVVRLDELLRAILDYSRAGRLKGSPEVLPLGSVVEEMVTMLAPSDPTVTITVRPNLPQVVSDPTFLKQILINLIGNALKHGARDGKTRIEVGAIDRGAFHEVFVRDHGPGLAQRHHARIFEIFSRVSEATDGSGIGLAVVRRLVDAQGGRVWLESEEGKGSTFRFSLPKIPV